MGGSTACGHQIETAYLVVSLSGEATIAPHCQHDTVIAATGFVLQTLSYVKRSWHSCDRDDATGLPIPKSTHTMCKSE
ncbi:MAG: hypothetical protein DSM106950_29240 [Stigonema ocellatum SAG 48.90 = DSM 106950]|nr:hypothetical protein [Stigonema ocellatum SAG 48.90 = DSM 106950]